MREICLTDDLFSIHGRFDEQVAATAAAVTAGSFVRNSV